MPCDYKEYPPDWHTVIRPRIRGTYRGIDAYQRLDDDFDCKIYDGADSRYIGEDYNLDDDNGKIITIRLTIMHLDHNTKNNDDSNLKAGCQRCHLRYDSEHHQVNARVTRNKKKGLGSLFPE